MIDKRAEAGSVNYAEILAKGLKAEEPAAQAVAWNAPSMDVSAAMANLMLGSAASATQSEPTLTTSAMRDAVDFAEAKSQLKALVSEAERVIAGMQPGPEKTNALGALAAARSASPADIRTVLAELSRIIAEATSKELGVNAMVSAREEAEAERERLNKKWSDLQSSIEDELKAKGFSEEKREEIKEQVNEQRDKAIEAAQNGDLQAAQHHAEAAGQIITNTTGNEELGRDVQDNVEASFANAAKIQAQNPEAGRSARKTTELTSSAQLPSNAFDNLTASSISAAIDIEVGSSVTPNIQKQATTEKTTEPAQPSKPSGGIGF